MSDDSEKELDPEVDIKFTADKQVREYFKKKGIIDLNDSNDDAEDETRVEVDSKDEIEVESASGIELPDEDELVLDGNTETVVLEETEVLPEIQIVDEPIEKKIKEVTKVEPVKSKLIFFDYRSEFFAYLIKELGDDLNYKIVEEFEELPRELQENKNLILFLNYSAYPKLCSQLIPKVKSKFDQVKIVIVAKNLTAEKVKAHKESAEGVHDYLSFPFSRDDFFKVISN